MTLTRRAFLAAPSLAASAAGRPNMILILADDLGWRDVGFNGAEFETPNIDRIAREGVRFEQLYAYPLCTPTRAGLMTGRSPARMGLIYSVIRPWSAYGVPREERLMPETFRALGYQTAMVGKWHLGHAHATMLPHNRGFDHFYGFVNAEIDHFEHTKLGGLDWQRNGKGVREPGYATTLMAEEAVRLIERRDRNRPFFLYAAFNAIHAPMQAPEEALRKFAHIQQKNRRVVAAMTWCLDEAVGRILAALDRQGMARETIVLFLSDNGGAPGLGSDNRPWRGGKMTCFEGGIRVAAALRYPGKVTAGGKATQLMSVLDLLPTLAAAAGGQPVSTQPLDGRNMWPQITGAAEVEREPMFFACKRNETADYQFGLRHGPWKLIREINASKPSPPDLLFHIGDDPQEQKNLAASQPEVVKRLAAELDRWRALHPKTDIDSSMNPHPGWFPPRDYAEAAGYAVYNPSP